MSKVLPFTGLWAECLGCTESCENQCYSNPDWKSPVTIQEVFDYSEQLSTAIFRARKTISRMELFLSKVEPIHNRLVDMEYDSLSDSEKADVLESEKERGGDE